MSCTPSEVRDKFITKLSNDGLLKTTKNIRAYSNNIVITWDGNYIKDKNAAYLIAKSKVDKINKIGKETFPSFGNQTYARIDGENSDFVRLYYGLPSRVYEAYRVKTGQSTVDNYIENTKNEDFYNGDDALRIQEENDMKDEEYFDLYPDTLELNQDDKDVVFLYDRLSKELAELNGEPLSKEEIEQVLFKYNQDNGFEKTKIPDLTSRDILNKLKQVRNDYIQISIDRESTENIKNTAKKNREIHNSFKNDEEYKKYSGSYKSLAKRLADLIKDAEDQLSKVKINLDEAKKNKQESRVKELLNRVSTLEGNLNKLQDQFDHVVKQRSLEPMIEVATKAIVDISNSLSRNFISSEDYVDTLETIGKAVAYWDSVLNDTTRTFFDPELEGHQFESLTNKKILLGTDKFELLKEESKDGKTILVGLEILKNKVAVLTEQYLQRVAEEETLAIKETIEKVSSRVTNKDLRKDFKNKISLIQKDKALNEGELSKGTRIEINTFLTTLKDMSSVSKEDRETVTDFLRDFMDNTEQYINIHQQIKDVSYPIYLAQDLSRSGRIVDQVLAKLIQGNHALGSVKAQESIDKINKAVENLLKKYTEEEVNNILYRSSKSGGRSMALRGKYTPGYEEDYHRENEALNEVYSILKDIRLDSFEKIDRVKKIREKFSKYLEDTRSSANLDVLFGHLFKDIPYLEVKEYTEAEKKAETDKLISELGEKEAKELLERQEESIRQYLLVRESQLENLEEFVIHEDATYDEGLLNARYTNIRKEGGKVFGVKKTEYDKFIADDIKNNPLVYSNFIKYRKVTEYKDIPIYSSPRYFESVPKKYRNGVETGYYDKEYEKIQNDPDLKTYHDILVNTIKKQEALRGKKNPTGAKLVTQLEKSIFETLVSTRVGKNPIYTFSNLLKSLKTIKDRIYENFIEISRVYGVKEDTFDKTILTLNNKYDFANKEKIDKIFDLEKENIKISLIKEGYVGTDLTKELEKRTEDLRDQIVENLVQNSVQDLKVVASAMILETEALEHKSMLLPHIRLYHQGLKNITKGKRSKIIDTNLHGEVKLDENDKVKTKDSDRMLKRYESIIKTFAGYSIKASLGKSTKLVPTIGGTSNYSHRTAQEKEEIKALEKLYEDYKKLQEEGKITEDQLQLEKAKIDGALAKYSVYIAPTLDRVINATNKYIVAKALYWSGLGSLNNRLGGFASNAVRSGRYYSFDSFRKASAILNKSSQSLGLIGGSVGSALIPLALGVTNPVGIIALVIGGGAVSYSAFKKLGEVLSNRDSRVQKVINIASAFDIFKWGELLTNPDSLQASIDRRIEGLKPMTYLKNSEFLNAVEQMLALLIEMKVKVIHNGSEKTVTWEELYNQDGSVVAFDGYIVPGSSSPVNRDQFVKYVSSVNFHIAQSTGQYDSKFPIEAMRYSIGRTFAMFNRWKFTDLMNYLESEETVNYTTPDFINNKAYKTRKGVITTLRHTYGKAGGLSIASVLSGSAAYIASGSIATATSLSIAIPLIGAAGLIGYTAYRTFKGYKGAKKNYDSPDILTSLKRLSVIIPGIGFHQKFKLENPENAKLFSSVSTADMDNLKFIRNLGTGLLTMAVITEVLGMLGGDDDKEDKLAMLIEYMGRQISSNMSGAFTVDGFARDAKGGFGYNNFIHTEEGVGYAAAHLGALIAYYATGLEYFEKSAFYQTKNKKKGVEKGDVKFFKDLEKLTPALNKLTQVQESISK